MKLANHSLVAVIFIAVFSSISAFGQQTYSYKTGDPADWPKKSRCSYRCTRKPQNTSENEKLEYLKSYSGAWRN